MQLMKNEQIYFEVAANLFRGAEAVGGKLTITDRRMLFHSHAFNLQTGSTEIVIENIQEVKKRNTWGIVPNGLSVRTKDGKEYKFVVWNRKKLIGFINQRIAG